MKILVAEDDVLSRKLLTATLEQFGHTVVAHVNGEDAWKAYDAEPVRVVVSDWLMPKMDGLEFCRKVRARPNTEYTYFILLTANARGKETTLEAMQAGIDDFMPKPLDRDTIWMRLRVAERILRYATQVNILEAMLPICMYCKKVRDDKDYWEQVETYITERTGASFSHGICPSCYETRVKPEIAKMKALAEGFRATQG